MSSAPGFSYITRHALWLDKYLTSIGSISLALGSNSKCESFTPWPKQDAKTQRGYPSHILSWPSFKRRPSTGYRGQLYSWCMERMRFLKASSLFQKIKMGSQLLDGFEYINRTITYFTVVHSDPFCYTMYEASISENKPSPSLSLSPFFPPVASVPSLLLFLFMLWVYFRPMFFPFSCFLFSSASSRPIFFSSFFSSNSYFPPPCYDPIFSLRLFLPCLVLLIRLVLVLSSLPSS